MDKVIVTSTEFQDINGEPIEIKDDFPDFPRCEIKEKHEIDIENLEKEVWAGIGVRIVIRIPLCRKIFRKAGLFATQWGAIKEDRPISYLVETIRKTLAEDLPTDIAVIMGNGEQPHPNTLIRTVIQSYK